MKGNTVWFLTDLFKYLFI